MTALGSPLPAPAPSRQRLRGLIAIDPQRAGKMLDRLIQYLRATLSVSRAGTTRLEQEFSVLEACLGLMSVRMGIGLSTTRERLQVLYGERAAAELLPSPPQGAQVRLTLPLELP